MPCGDSCYTFARGTFSIQTTFCGSNGTSGYTGDGNFALNATFNNPFSIAFDPSTGSLVICDTGSLIAGSFSFALCLTSVAFFCTSCPGNHALRSVNRSSLLVSTIAGNGTAGYNCNNNCVPTTTLLRGPRGIAFDGLGTMYISGASAVSGISGSVASVTRDVMPLDDSV